MFLQSSKFHLFPRECAPPEFSAYPLEPTLLMALTNLLIPYIAYVIVYLFLLPQTFQEPLGHIERTLTPLKDKVLKTTVITMSVIMFIGNVKVFHAELYTVSSQISHV